MTLSALARRSIHFRLWVLLVAMSLAILLLATTIIGVYGWSRQRNQFEKQLVAMADLVALNSASTVAFDDAETALVDLTQVRKHEAILYAGILDAQGRVFAESGVCTQAPILSGGNLDRATIHYHGRLRICVTTPMRLDNKVIGYVRLEQDLSEMNREVLLLGAGAVGIFLFTLLVAIFLSHRIGHTITGPVTELADQVRRISEAHTIDGTVEVTTQDEIGDLAHGINAMLKSLTASRRELEAALSLQHTLFDTIPMPVYGKDLGRRITAMNQRFAIEVIGRPSMDILNCLQEDFPGTFDAGALALLRRREQDLLVSGREAPFEVEGRDASGKARIYLVRLGLYQDAAGRTAGFMGVMQDMTEVRRIGRELVNVSMREQQRLARDLHDNLGQLLTATACKIKMLDHHLPAGRNDVRDALNEAIGLVNRAAREARALSHGLNPVDVEQGGLVAALEELATSTSVYTRLTCRFAMEGDLSNLDKETSNQLYRIAQEAVSNAVRHARASVIDIRLARSEEDMVLSVTDNGRGFPADEVVSGAGMGLRIMNQRALMIHGEITCRTLQACGAEVVCRCPARLEED